jgi:hypothetical protein
MKRLKDFFPDSDHPGLQANVARLLRVRPEELDSVLEKMGDELIFHVATNPGLRNAIHVSASPQITASATPRRGLASNEPLLKHASRSLRRQMGLR